MPFFASGLAIELTIVSVAALGTTTFTLLDRWRARRRNDSGRCSRCGQPWAAAYPDPSRYLVQGTEICAPCAGVLRDRLPAWIRRLAWTFAFAPAWTSWEVGLAPLLGGWFKLGGLMWLGTPVLGVAAAASVLALAARQNRRALARTHPLPELAEGPESDESSTPSKSAAPM